MKQLKDGLTVVVGLTVLLLAAGLIQFIATTSKVSSSTVTIAGQSFSVERADTAEERARGLMGRLTLGEKQGMLFIFDDSESRSFWNQDTLIPLDVIFIDQGRVVAVEQLPKFDSAFGPITVSPETPAQYVLELNQGSGVRVGDRVEINQK
ncbi:DUF192 domain-containing protein [Candidatus Berkelbacteria bacterium]|nr:DUF192 domain-containing protein [Candidatus Berkelbacteria bacterium]